MPGRLAGAERIAPEHVQVKVQADLRVRRYGGRNEL
jgi:hypothetical protein